MESIATAQYPQIVWKEGDKKLWNPIHRKALKNKPEERVRLRIIEYLIASGWSKHRISTEEALKNYKKDTLRTDIICYSQDFNPKILIECKAEHISLSGKTAEQAARYNQNVEAPFLLMTNGVEDFWYRIHRNDHSVKSLSSLPEILPQQLPDKQKRDFNYWKKRGFAGSKADPALRKWITSVMQYFDTDDAIIRHLRFKKSPSDLDLNHYYYIHEYGRESKTALTFLSTPFGGSRMIGILNSDGENKAVAEINLDLIFKKTSPNTSIYSSRGVNNIDLGKFTKKPVPDIQSRALADLAKLLEPIFDHFGP